MPLYDELRQAERPRTVFTWTGRDHVQRLLRLLARGQSPLTHERLNRLAPPRSVAYLRDRHLVFFALWLEQWLTDIDDQEHRELLERIASWSILRGLRNAATHDTVGKSRECEARCVLRKAKEFLDRIDEHDISLAGCTQADLDAWHAGTFLACHPAQKFLRWAMASHLMLRLFIPHRNTTDPASIGHDKRMELLRRAAEDKELDRVIMVLALLFNQPFSRIYRLTLDGLIEEDGRIGIRFGTPPTWSPNRSPSCFGPSSPDGPT